MNFIHAREYVSSDQLVRIDCDTQCNVMLTSDTDFENFKRQESYRYFGGFFKRFPAFIAPPHSGYWVSVKKSPSLARGVS